MKCQREIFQEFCSEDFDKMQKRVSMTEVRKSTRPVRHLIKRFPSIYFRVYVSVLSSILQSSNLKGFNFGYPPNP